MARGNRNVNPRPQANPVPEQVDQRQLLQMQMQVAWKGPIPDPDTAIRYKDVDASWPERILKMAESEQEIRHLLSTQKLTQNLRRAMLGLLLGFAAVVVLAAIAALAVWKDQPWVAGTLGGLDIVGVAGSSCTR